MLEVITSGNYSSGWLTSQSWILKRNHMTHWTEQTSREEWQDFMMSMVFWKNLQEFQAWRWVHKDLLGLQISQWNIWWKEFSLMLWSWRISSSFRIISFFWVFSPPRSSWYCKPLTMDLFPRFLCNLLSEHIVNQSQANFFKGLWEENLIIPTTYKLENGWVDNFG